MKKLPVLILLLCSALAASHLFSEQPREMRFESLREAFKDPSSSFRSAPLWVWNTKVSNADIDRMLAELKEQGFGGAFVHPRPGLITDYLSDDWFALYRHSVDTGKKLGLDIWIYDENSYPSGFAGGHVPAVMPESYNQGQGLNYKKTETVPDNTQGLFFCLKKDGNTFTDITASLADYKGVAGEYYVYNKTFYGRSDWHGGYSYVDLLYPGVTERFMEVTMSGYEKHLGKELGREIKGIFTDEPNVSSPGGIRWTPDLFDVFKKQWGYDLKSVLPLLVEESGDWKRVRHNYMETLTQLFIDRWAKPWFEYCEKKNLLWTGHYWEHGWPDMSHGGDNMAMYAWHQMPAIDMLFNQFNDTHPQAQFGNIRSVKELRSVANQMGYVRTLSETYGGGGWDVTFEDLKRLGDWEYVLGVNFMNQHLSHMTIVGARKYDYPPVFTSLSPWWSDYKAQNDYFARLSLLLSQGEQINDILILEPTTTAWLYFSYVRGHQKTMDVGVSFQHFVTELEKSQVEYDLGSENIIKDRGSVSGQSFVIGKRGYKTVVIPPMTENLNAVTFTLLREFVDAGGELIAFSSPTLINGKENEALKQFFKDNASRIKTYAEGSTADAIRESLQNDAISFRNIAGGNNLYHHRRLYDDGELLFLVNASLTETVSGQVTLKGKALTELDAMSGNLYAYPGKTQEDRIKATFVLPPAASLLLFSAASITGEYRARPVIANGKTVTAEGVTVIRRMQDNVLTLDFCDLTVDGKTENNLYTVEACNQLYRHFGMNDPWNSAIQYRQTIVEKDRFTTGDIRVQYHFGVSEAVETEGFRLVVEQPDLWTVKVNGEPITAIPGKHWLDSRFGVYAIGKLAKPGENVVELSRSPMSIYAEIAPVYLLGDFSLKSASAGWQVEPPVRLDFGSWKAQGQPFYSWDVSYAKHYRIADTSARYAVQLKSWKGTLAEVYVNDRKVGVIAYQPYVFDLSSYLEVGENKVEVRVIGSLKNLFGPHYNREKGIAGPWHWNGVKKQLPGSDYDLMDYGLTEDFVILSSE